MSRLGFLTMGCFLAQASRQHLPIPSFVETSPARQERGNAEAATVAAVEQTMKKYMDDLMRMMESVTGRIGQLESSTRRLEQMVTDFKSGSEMNQGASGGKLSLIESMLSEVWNVNFLCLSFMKSLWNVIGLKTL